MDQTFKDGGHLPSVKRMVVGGSAAPRSMIERFDRWGIKVSHSWGMTETSPQGTCGRLSAAEYKLSHDDRMKLHASQGKGVYAVELRLVDDNGNELPHDGKTSGELEVRGP